MLAANTLAITVLDPRSTVLLSNEAGAWVLTLAAGGAQSTLRLLMSVQTHPQLALQAMGCGLVATSANLSPFASANSNSTSPVQHVGSAESCLAFPLR